jgi:hypothetical protein
MRESEPVPVLGFRSPDRTCSSDFSGRLCVRCFRIRSSCGHDASRTITRSKKGRPRGGSRLLPRPFPRSNQFGDQELRHKKSLPSGVGLFVALAVLSCLQAEAQPTCQQLTAVKTWNGSYNLQGVGSGSANGESITVNHTMMSSVTFSEPTGTCSQLVWTRSDSSSSGSLNDTATLPPATQTLTGSGSNQVPPPQLTRQTILQESPMPLA